MMRLLGVSLNKASLPQIVSCPVCQARHQLSIYHDTATEGEWAYCRSCRFAGDMIGLAGAVWKLQPADTIIKLSQSDEISTTIANPDLIEKYVVRCERKQRQLRFWNICRSNQLTATGELREIQRKIHAVCFPGWDRRLSDLLGVATKKELLAHLRTHKSFFAGTKWDSVAVIPYQDLPGRLCGFLLMTREGNPATDWLYCSLAGRGGKGPAGKEKEGGVAMLSALLREPHHVLGATKFVFTDPDVMVRFHTRHCEASQRPLPLASMWETERWQTRRPWEWLPRSETVVWGLNFLDALTCAYHADAKVAMLEMSRDTLDHDLRNRSPQTWLVEMRRSAVPWQVAMATYLESATEMASEALFTRLEMTPTQIAEFLPRCSPLTQERLSYLLRHPTGALRVRVDGNWIAEQSDGWYMSKNGDRITNAIVRIEKVITTRDHNSYYRGHIKFKGKEYSFTEKAEVVDRNMFKWAHAYLRDVCKAGLSEYYTWCYSGLQIALAFHTPECEQGVETVGWDDGLCQFNFPSFVIRSGGEVRREESCLFDDDNLPGQHLPSPGAFPAKHKMTLSELNDETQLVWATAACVAGNVIAPAVNSKPVSTLFDGEGGRTAGASIAANLGCIVTDKRVTTKNFCRNLALTRGEHRWPLVVHYANSVMEEKYIDEAQGDLLLLPDMTNLIVGIRGRHQLIRNKRRLGTAKTTQAASSYLIGHYIQDLCSRNLLLYHEFDDIAQNVLTDMREWFFRLGGNPEAVEHARDILITPGTREPCDYFIDLVFNLFEKGAMRYERTAFTPRKAKQPQILQIDGQDKPSHVWVDQDAFAEEAKRAGSLAPDLLLITKSLQDSNVLVDEPILGRKRGWLLHEDWWNVELSRWREND